MPVDSTGFDFFMHDFHRTNTSTTQWHGTNGIRVCGLKAMVIHHLGTHTVRLHSRSLTAGEKEQVLWVLIVVGVVVEHLSSELKCGLVVFIDRKKHGLESDADLTIKVTIGQVDSGIKARITAQCTCILEECLQ